MTETQRYYVSINDESQGPFELPALREKLKAGEISEDTQVWGEGIEKWQPLWTALSAPAAPAAPAPAPAAAPPVPPAGARMGTAGTKIATVSGFAGVLAGAAVMLILEACGVVFLGRYTQPHFTELTTQLAGVRRESREHEAALNGVNKQLQAQVSALQAFLRNVKLARVTACKRAMQEGRWDDVDRLLVELDQLALLVPDDEEESKVRDDLIAKVTEFKKTLPP